MRKVFVPLGLVAVLTALLLTVVPVAAQYTDAQ